jgi:hypothetical protein
VEDVATQIQPCPENTLLKCDDGSPGSASCRKPRQFRKLHLLSVPTTQLGSGHASISVLQVHNSLKVEGSQITAVDAECQPRQSTWISRSQQPDDGPEWESCPTADTETEDTSLREDPRRGRGQARFFWDSCEPSANVEDEAVMAQLLDVLRAEELCCGCHKRSSSEVSGIDFEVSPTRFSSPLHSS